MFAKLQKVYKTLLVNEAEEIPPNPYILLIESHKKQVQLLEDHVSDLRAENELLKERLYRLSGITRDETSKAPRESLKPIYGYRSWAQVRKELEKASSKKPLTKEEIS